MQFAILIGLIISTVTILRQTQYALNEGMGAQRDLIVQVARACRTAAFPDEVRKGTPGVAAAACSTANALNVPYANNVTAARTTQGRTFQIDLAPVDFGFFEVYGIKPVAGRLFDQAQWRRRRSWSEPGDHPAAAGPRRAAVHLNQAAADHCAAARADQ